MRLDRAVDAYLRHISIERGLSDHTVAAYRRDLGGYVAWLAAQGVAGLGSGDARARRRVRGGAGVRAAAGRGIQSRATAVLGARTAPVPRARGHRARGSDRPACGRRSRRSGCRRR